MNDIDQIVNIVRFDGWQDSSAGQKEVQKALRKSLLKYKLHKDQELFDRAYGYIREYSFPFIYLNELACLDLLADLPAVLVPKAVWREVRRYRPHALVWWTCTGGPNI